MDEVLNKYRKEINKHLNKFDDLWNSYNYDGDMENEDVLELIFEEYDNALDLLEDIYTTTVLLKERTKE